MTEYLRWRDVCGDDEVSAHSMKKVRAGRNEVLLVRVSTGLSAISSICPHEHAYLDDGSLEDEVITCAKHGWKFDCATGAGIKPRNAQLRTYPVRVLDGRVEIGLPAPAPPSA